MFAVPGWSVSSNVPTTQKSTRKHPPTSTYSEPEVAGIAAQKRKRSRSTSKPSDVNRENLSDLWETVIEKKIKLKIPGKGKRSIMRPSIVGEADDENPTTLNNSSTTGKEHVKSKKKYERPKEERQAMKTQSTEATVNDAKPLAAASAVRPMANLTPLQLSMRQKLISARFRYLNQILYTNPSAHSQELFRQNPEMFDEYHEGFRKQVEVWPENPLNDYIAQIMRRGIERSIMRKHNGPVDDGKGRQGVDIPLPRTDGICHIADLGCGDAGISRGLDSIKERLKLQVFSYDLQSSNPLVTRADIADLPLKDDSVDVAIFCLALMGINWIDFIEEAFRILRWRGELWITEIKSRFGRVRDKANKTGHNIENRKRPDKAMTEPVERDVECSNLLVDIDGHGKDKKEANVSEFIEVLRKRGFILQGERAIDLSNKMFVKMKFEKGHTPVKGKHVPVQMGTLDTRTKKLTERFPATEEILLSNEAAVLKPCVYKLR